MNRKVGQGDYRAGGSTTPSDMGGAVPPPMGGDISFTLQAIMELQRSTGEMTGALNNLSRDINKQEQAISSLNTKVDALSHKIYAATVVFAIVLAVGGWFVNKAWDLAVANIQVRPQVQQMQPSALPSVLPEAQVVGETQ